MSHGGDFPSMADQSFLKLRPGLLSAFGGPEEAEIRVQLSEENIGWLSD
jgi:hypothetical protein